MNEGFDFEMNELGDGLGDENTPLIPAGQGSIYTMDDASYTPQDRKAIKKSRVAELLTYIEGNGVENVPFEMQNLGKFSIRGKLLLYEEKPLTNYDGSFKRVDEIVPLLTGLDFVNEQDIPQMNETPKRPVTISKRTANEQRGEIVKQLVDKLYDHMAYDKNNLDLNLDRFRVRNAKGFGVLEYEKNGRWFRLTKETDGKFKTADQISKVINKTNLQQLGLSPVIKTLDRILPTEKEFENIPLQDLNPLVAEVSKLIGGNQLPMRELLGLDKALQRVQGELVNGAGKLTELEKRIAKEEEKLNEPDITKQQKERIKERIKELKENYDVRLESLSQIKDQLSTQLARIRQTIDKLADGDRTLKERLKLLWREQGLTLVAALTAIGMTISTLVLALLPSGAAAAGGGSGSGKSPHKVRNWVKKGLKSLGRLFGKLAKWALSALPGAIGAIISGIFNLLKTVVAKASEYAYATIGIGAAFASYLVFKK